MSDGSFVWCGFGLLRQSATACFTRSSLDLAVTSCQDMQGCRFRPTASNPSSTCVELAHQLWNPYIWSPLLGHYNVIERNLPWFLELQPHNAPSC